MASDPSFQKHHQLVAKGALPPSQALLEGLKYNPKPGTAADLGCGAGTDTLYLLGQGWRVFAIDQDRQALDRLNIAYPAEQLTTVCRRFEELQLPPLQLVNASFALPFCAPEKFPRCWKNICRAITPGGLFCGHFFGPRDSWAARPDMTFHTAEAFADLLKDFELLWQTETEKDGKTLGGAPKHWHVYHVAACKR